MCTISSTLLNNATWAALVCSSSDDSSPCSAICANPDLSGIGVRVAFYIQSFLNTLLVIFSPRDSVPSAWAGTLLTTSLIIAAMVQKGGSAITLHHATLVLNFATLSCISSLVVAPILPIWQLTPEEYCVRRLALDDDAAEGAIIDEKRIKQLEAAQSKERLILALALLTQVVLQWAWGIVLFVSPVYSQTNCSGDTKLIFFLTQLSARHIHDDKLFFVWVLWLLFSLGITLFMTIVLAVTSGPRSQNGLSRHSTFSSAGNSRSHSQTRAMRAVYASAIQAIPSWNNRGQLFIFCYNILAFALWLIFIVSSELQIRANCIFQGENNIQGFGQITALLLSLAPVWTLTVALYKYPKLVLKRERRQRRGEQQSQREGRSLLQVTNTDVRELVAKEDDWTGPSRMIPEPSRAVPASSVRQSPASPNNFVSGVGYLNAVNIRHASIRPGEIFELVHRASP